MCLGCNTLFDRLPAEVRAVVDDLPVVVVTTQEAITVATDSALVVLDVTCQPVLLRLLAPDELQVLDPPESGTSQDAAAICRPLKRSTPTTGTDQDTAGEIRGYCIAAGRFAYPQLLRAMGTVEARVTYLLSLVHRDYPRTELPAENVMRDWLRGALEESRRTLTV
jgi:hypothetical protein